MRLLMAEREKVVKALTLFSSTKEAEGFLPKGLIKETLKVNMAIQRMLKSKLKELDKALAVKVKEEQKLSHQFALILSVPGIGKQTALHLLVYTRCFECFPDWRKLACYAGIAPFPYTSGSSIRGRSKVSHLANKKLKTLLNMAALAAKRNDPELKKGNYIPVGTDANFFLSLKKANFTKKQSPITTYA